MSNECKIQNQKNKLSCAWHSVSSYYSECWLFLNSLDRLYWLRPWLYLFPFQFQIICLFWRFRLIYFYLILFYNFLFQFLIFKRVSFNLNDSLWDSLWFFDLSSILIYNLWAINYLFYIIRLLLTCTLTLSFATLATFILSTLFTCFIFVFKICKDKIWA